MIEFLDYKFNQEEHIQKILCPLFKNFCLCKILSENVNGISDFPQSSHDAKLATSEPRVAHHYLRQVATDVICLTSLYQSYANFHMSLSFTEKVCEFLPE
jgi:hypothetical protein